MISKRSQGRDLLVQVTLADVHKGSRRNPSEVSMLQNSDNPGRLCVRTVTRLPPDATAPLASRSLRMHQKQNKNETKQKTKKPSTWIVSLAEGAISSWLTHDSGQLCWEERTSIKWHYKKNFLEWWQFPLFLSVPWAGRPHGTIW